MANSKFHHEEIYRGKDLVTRLGIHHVVICGAGALGSNLAEALVRIGFSRLSVIDFDRVDAHNIGTQVFGEADVGALKVKALQTRLFRDTGVEIGAFDKKLDASNAKKLLRSACFVVDCFDNSASRQVLQETCRHERLPLLHCGLFDTYGEVIWNQRYRVPNDAEGDVCDYPLARNLIQLVVAIAAEEILDYCLAQEPRGADWTVTLKDLQIRRMQ